MGLYHVVLATSKSPAEKLTLIVTEVQKSPNIEKSDSKEEFSCLKWTIYNARRKVCVNFETDTDKLNIVVYGNQNSLYHRDNEISLNLTKYQSPLTK